MYVREKIELSPHFKSVEFKCPHCNNIYINTDLIDMLEKIINSSNATKCVINSGYRCGYYDTIIGGFKGQHSKGNACDCKFYSNSVLIPSWKILCVCQDLFKEGGFAKINNYSIHIDCRKGSIYRGDETISNNSVTYNFYEYFKKRKEDVYEKNLNLLNNSNIEKFKGVLKND